MLPYVIAVVVVALYIPVIIHDRLLGFSLDWTQTQIVQQLVSSNNCDRNCVVGIVIPGTRNRNVPADNSHYVKEAKCLFASQYGGYTALPNAEGGWILEDIGELIEEPGVFVLALVTKEELSTSQDVLVAFGLYLKQELDQEAISIIINGNLKFI
ncbi:hypothetical protein L2E68_12540 [Planktothrix agardhii 1029]|uniref:hypothetical protein n=1 Tax=Planktothrix agardhii TaxID=1160 RepID=UPI001F46A781|nr:hypothetical protein [Planktothrix agardhii]MCF3568606.1 hypothetical protein [Planktothrix agardhii 1807]MCF3590309.1 hypothetical protein [Planktothrix agardhii 1029]